MGQRLSRDRGISRNALWLWLCCHSVRTAQLIYIYIIVKRMNQFSICAGRIKGSQSLVFLEGSIQIPFFLFSIQVLIIVISQQVKILIYGNYRQGIRD